MRQFSNSFVYPALMLSTVLLGCGGTSNQATVDGVVTLEGAPVPSGSISFVPASGGTQSYAMSDASGNYEVYTGREAGLKPGEYNVTIVARERPAVNQTELGGPAPAGAAITPAWYASPETSGLKFTVAPGANEINLELSKQAPAGWREPAKRR
ncbi:carboxypeptidase-like regulatory domain-containing protein [Lacipirellula sp.]|uniref:carboxypeptidase-like regulatory domain-containing protein n=1 Tax=Lacipirellula sp. TaxID=2691419 RepID=UPI003D0E72AF